MDVLISLNDGSDKISPFDINRPPSCASGIALLSGASRPSNVSFGSLEHLLKGNNEIGNSLFLSTGCVSRAIQCSDSGISSLPGTISANLTFPSTMSSMSSFLNGFSRERIADTDGATEKVKSRTAGSRGHGKHLIGVRSASNYQANEEWDMDLPKDNNLLEQFL